MSRVSMNNKVSFQEFNEFLLSEIQDSFPDIELYIISNGDHVSNLIMEARTENNRIQFCPYELWQCDNPEIETLKLMERLNTYEKKR